jgi:hypothetical protein
MAFAAQALAGMTVFQTACVLKVSFHARLSQTFGCGQRTQSLSILLFISMIWQLLWLIRRNFWNVLEKKQKFKLKGTGTIAFHLGCNFFCDDEDILCMAPNKYTKKMMMGYVWGEAVS